MTFAPFRHGGGTPFSHGGGTPFSHGGGAPFSTAGGGQVYEWGPDRVRAGPWRGDRCQAYLAPLTPAAALSADFLRRCLDSLAAQGYASVVTTALVPAEWPPFLGQGFEEQERLRLLTSDLQGLRRSSPGPSRALRRGRKSDWAAVLELDGAAFAPFWRLDTTGLAEALHATPLTRFRVATVDRRIAGYSVAGCSETHGYLQRLAVGPARRRSGLGRALVHDSLRWMRRRGVERAVVNTQLGNEAALALYLSLGFRLEATELAVLRRRLG